MGKTEVFYSIFAANILTQSNVPNFKISDSTIRNYLKEGKLGKLTYKNVLAMKHRNRNHEKKAKQMLHFIFGAQHAR